MTKNGFKIIIKTIRQKEKNKWMVTAQCSFRKCTVFFLVRYAFGFDCGYCWSASDLFWNLIPACGGIIIADTSSVSSEGAAPVLCMTEMICSHYSIEWESSGISRSDLILGVTL